MAQKTKGNYSNNLFSNHFLEERIQDLEEWEEVDAEEKFDELKKIYEEKKNFLSESLNEDQTQNHFIDPVLKALGHEWVPEARTRVGSSKKGTVLNPDYTFMDMATQMDAHEDEETSYFDVNYAVGDAKAWNRTLDKSTQDHTNPAFQIYNYVDRLRADWGILTNGKKWRLYSYEKCAADIYFEIDLEKILSGEKTEEDLEAFKYFYMFFKAESFEEGFLEKVHRQSVQYNEELEDDLEDKVYNALEVAVEGFFETNDIEKAEENIDIVHHSSLIFLYRILFILNAESRDLLPTEDEAYRQAFGLMELKRMIVEGEETHIFQDTTVAWDSRLSRLFEGIDEGYPLDDSEIPAYNGGLFDEENSEENQFLAENKLYGNYIKEILELLATRYDEDKEQRVIVDYKDLNIRHLGSVYEGLLEHQFKAADERKILKNEEWQNFSETSKDWEEFDEEKRVEKDELYLTNESGERKATGSYYTPEYIVEYIVKNTVGPKVEEKIDEAEENDDSILPKILELNVVDPAMGSGHFLTEATEFIAEKIVEHANLENQDIDENEDELNWAKRQVVQNCIYGVDINELAVELGKLSLWIETMAEGKPLNFLDHHLKHGNSLIGSDFDEIFSHPTQDQTQLDSNRFKFSDPQEIKENFQEQYLEIEQMPENTVQQIHEKEKAYKKFISNNTLYQQFRQLANIHTRQFFSEEADSSDYESFLINIGNPGNPYEDTDWYTQAQEDAEDRNYFHWQLEFPKVFFGQTQGFDAVVGNPPYVVFAREREGRKSDFVIYQEVTEEEYSYYEENYPKSSSYAPNAFALMTERMVRSLGDGGEFGFIYPSTIQYNYYYEDLRSWLSEEYQLDKVVNIDHVFDEAETGGNTILTLRNSKGSGDVQFGNAKNPEYLDELNLSRVSRNKLESVPYSRWPSTTKLTNIFGKIDENSNSLGGLGDFYQGVCTGDNDRWLNEEDNTEDTVEVLRGEDVNRYLTEWNGVYLDFKKDEMWSNTNEELLGANPKILIRQTGDSLVASLEENGRFIIDSLYLYNPKDEGDVDFLLPIINSRFLNSIYRFNCPELDRAFAQVKVVNLRPLPIPKISDEEKTKLRELSEEMRGLRSDRSKINTNIRDYLGNYSDGEILGDLYSPVKGLSDSVLTDTADDRDSLRIGDVKFEERNGELVLKASARYKPEDNEGFSEDELDRWGYTETELVPAMKFTDLSEELKALVREFVPVAVDEAGGFAGFRESATKTNSVIDRLEKLTLPKLDDVESGLKKFIENREEAEELEEEIQETDELIDAIVFNLYDLTEEEVETVLDSLDTSEGEKASILEKFNSSS